MGGFGDARLECGNRLLLAAEQGPLVKSLSGPDRARLYALALGTGFRAAELGSLTPESFHLDSDPPTATVKAGYSKRRRDDVQPIRGDLAEAMRPWIASKPPGEPLFRLTDRTAEMLRVDLGAAGIPHETASGTVDFHSLRFAAVTSPESFREALR